MAQKRLVACGALLASFSFLFGLGSSAFAEAWCYDFKADLKWGSRGYAVGALQAALQKEGLLAGKLDAIFGQRTRKALISFQEKYKGEVLTPLKLRNGTGFAGQATRTKLNQLYGCTVRAAAPASLPAVLATSSIAVLSPNGSEKISQGTDLTVKWTSSGLDKVSIILINYVTGDQTEIANSLSASLGKYSWKVPSSATAGNKYKVSVKSGKTADLSDNYFSIASIKKTLAPSLALLSPLGGEQWAKGTTHPIKWLFQDIDKIDSIVLTNYSSNVNYSLGTDIGASQNANSFDWAIPSASSIIPVGNSYRIRLKSCLGAVCYSDQSDNYFSIVSSTTTGSSVAESSLADIAEAISKLGEEIREFLGR